MEETHWYRARVSVSLSQASLTEWGDYEFHPRKVPTVDVVYERFRVIRHTPKGVWLAGTYDWLGNQQEERFILRRARKRWACPTKEEARESLIARTQRRAKILDSQLKAARAAVEQMKDGRARESEVYELVSVGDW